MCLPYRSSFHLYVSFPGIGSLFFLKLNMLLGAHLQLYVTARFFEKNRYQANMTKNGQKWPQNRVFRLFKKSMSLVLFGICVKWKFLRLINILRKLHAWKKLGSQVIAKNGSSAMRFRYSLIVNILLIY